MKKLNIWTDGACRGNPGPGGWCARLHYDGNVEVLSDGARLTTNNRMELYGVIAGLERAAAAFPDAENIVVTTDSRYVSEAINKRWVSGWSARSWRKSDGKPVKNADLWQRLLPLLRPGVTFRWVRGHAGTAENEACDREAVRVSKLPDLPEDAGYLEDI